MESASKTLILWPLFGGLSFCLATDFHFRMRLRPCFEQVAKHSFELGVFCCVFWHMDRAAVDQARTKLRKAEESLSLLEKATNYEEAEDAWADFVQHAGTVYSKLEQGAKSSGSSNGWFGRKKKERKDDPLLRYLKYARNANEHGIERTVAHNTGSGHSVATFKPLKFGERQQFTGDLTEEGTGRVLAKNLNILQLGPSIKLITAYDRRYNDHCDPPSSHMGKPIEFGGLIPLEIGKLGLTYLRALVSEAETLVS
jgi:hypothetical protein